MAPELLDEARPPQTVTRINSKGKALIVWSIVAAAFTSLFALIISGGWQQKDPGSGEGNNPDDIH